MLMLRIETRQAEGEPPCVFTWPPWSLRALLGHGPLVCLLCCTLTVPVCLLPGLSWQRWLVPEVPLLPTSHRAGAGRRSGGHLRWPGSGRQCDCRR